MMAKPKETVYSRLSVVSQSLFHIKPLPPFHHVPNVDKSSKRTEYSPLLVPNRTRGQNLGKDKMLMDSLLDNPSASSSEASRTQVQWDDFFPRLTSAKVDRAAPLPRPPLLGLMLEPRQDPLLLLEQKGEWEYILRRCFVREAITLRDAMKTIAFGGEALLPKIGEDESRYRGCSVRGDAIIRDISPEGWARIVDVFSKWPFKPPMKDILSDANIDMTISRAEKRKYSFI